MPPKIKVSQEAFDAAVQENIDEFGMDPAEAIEEALTTFRMQGADVSGLLTTSAGERQNHPAVAAVRAVEAASSQAATNASDAHTDALIGALDALLHECGASTPRETSDGGAASGPETDARKLATAAGAVQVVLQVARCHGASSAHVTAAAFSTLRHLLGDEAGRDLFLDHEGHVAAGHALSWHPDVPRVHVAVAEAVAAASKAHEGNMISFMQHGVGSQLLDSVRGHMGVPDVVAAASRAICSLVVADDEKALASKAFSHSLELGKCGAAELLLEALRKYSAPGGSAGELRVDVLSSLCGSLRRLASNDDICKKVTEAGGVSLLMHILDVSPGPEIARSVFPVLRQLSNSDEVKRAIVAEGGLQRLLAALSLYGADDGILEKVLAVLANVTLRNPDAAARAAELSSFDVLAEVMAAQDGSARVQRQACMVIRNLVARNPENREPALEKNLEPLIRKAMATHKPCKDAASGALRDLGLDNYT